MELKRRTGKFKEEDEYNRPGRDFKEIVGNYAKYTTKTEFNMFLGIPFLVAFLVFIYFWIFEESNNELLGYILEMNSASLSVIAILAGFNTTSLSIIAASNNRVLRHLQKYKLKSKNNEDNTHTVLQQLISFISFAILFQLIVLIMGVILFIISKSFPKIPELLPFLQGLAARIPLTIFGVIWLSAILFAIIISIRNATLLYRYVLYIADYKGDGN